jgi:heme-degrading monooxygenase HmoA
MGELIRITRWSMKHGATESAVLRLIRESIIPAYRQAPGCRRLGLLRVEGSNAYLAMQYWENREAYDRWQREAPPEWLDSYRPILESWDELMTFEDQQETRELLD